MIAALENTIKYNRKDLVLLNLNWTCNEVQQQALIQPTLTHLIQKEK